MVLHHADGCIEHPLLVSGYQLFIGILIASLQSGEQ
jgi:hypothetical protein